MPTRPDDAADKVPASGAAGVVLPGFVVPAPGAAGMSLPAAVAVPAGDLPAVGLTLTPEPSPASGDGKVTKLQLNRWSEIYGVDHRQLRRWIARGKLREDPCPLDSPAKMPAWIEKHLEKKRATLVEMVNLAASQAVATASEPPGPGAGSVGQSQSDAVPSGKPAHVMVPSLDLAMVGGVEGESVEFFRVIFAAVKKQLADAYVSGIDSEIRKLHARLKDVGESLRKHEKDAEQRAIRLGSYLDKAEVFNEITEALNTLARLREHRGSRVRAELADMPAEVLERICRELDQIGRREEAVLRSLATLKTQEDVSLRLAA